MRLRFTLPVFLLALLAPGGAMAVEGGVSPYSKGMLGFMSGITPPPGFYLTDMFYNFHGSVGAEVRNGIAEFNVSTHTDIDAVQGTWATDATLLGGRYSASAALAYVDLGVTASIAAPAGSVTRHLHSGGLSDFSFSPITLGWESGNFHWTAGLEISAPTGPYHPGALNMGRNFWAFMPDVGATWYDPASGLDVSGTLTYVTMTRNDATDYQSGDLLHFDWGIGWHFGAGQAWEIGVNGSVMEQLAGDNGTGAVLGPLKAQSFAIGPALDYRTELAGLPLSLSARWEGDFSAQKTMKGDLIVLTATAKF